MKPVKPVRWRLARRAALGLLLVTGTAWANGPDVVWFTAINFSNGTFGIQGSDQTPRVTLIPGERHPFRLCATATLAKQLHRKTRPGTPLGATLHWTRAVTGSRVVASPRAGLGGHLPGHTEMTGPIGSGRYCSRDLVAGYADFPANGTWTLHATIDGTKIGSELNWVLLPRKFNGSHHGAIGTPRLPIHNGGTHVRRSGQQRQTAQRNHLKVPVVHSRSREKSKKQREGGFVPRVTGTAWPNRGSELLFTYFYLPGGYLQPDETPHIKLIPGETHVFRFCATAAVVKKAHQRTRPGAPLGVTLHWTRVRTSRSVVTSLRTGRGGHLPGHTEMTSLTSGGRYCSRTLTVRYANFPTDGTWTMVATVDGIAARKLATKLDWDVLPAKFSGPHHGVIGTSSSPIHNGGTHVRRNGQQRQSAPTTHLKVPVVHSRSREKSKRQREGGFVPRVTGTAGPNSNSELLFSFFSLSIGTQGYDMTPHIKLIPGQTHVFRFCATADVVKKAHRKTRPGAPLGVTLHWTRVATSRNVDASRGASRGGHLPGHTEMTSLTSGGRYCSRALMVRYANFPTDGAWTMVCTVDGIDGTKLATKLDWDVLPSKFTGPHHGAIGTPRLPIHNGGTHVRRGGQQRQSAPTTHLKVPVVHSHSREKSKNPPEGGFVPRDQY